MTQTGTSFWRIDRPFSIIWTTAATPRHTPRFDAAHAVSLHIKCFHFLRRMLAVLPVLLFCNGAAMSGPIIHTKQSSHHSRIAYFANDIAEAANRFGIPEEWIRAVMSVESHNKWNATSPKGAMGLMQIMPKTYADLRARHGLGNNPYEPHDNILAGAAYLREMHDLFGSPGFLAAYNAGPDRYSAYLMSGQRLPAETIAYVATLAPRLGSGTADDKKLINFAGANPGKSNQAPLFIEQMHRVWTSIQTALNSPQQGTSNAARVKDLSALEPPHNGVAATKAKAASLFVKRPIGAIYVARNMAFNASSETSSFTSKR
jgi:SLT domain-containing protein